MMGTYPSHRLTLGTDETLSGELDNEEGAGLGDTDEEEAEDISVEFSSFEFQEGSQSQNMRHGKGGQGCDWLLVSHSFTFPQFVS